MRGVAVPTGALTPFRGLACLSVMETDQESDTCPLCGLTELAAVVSGRVNRLRAFSEEVMLPMLQV
jgi:hypothetical protein